MVDERTGALLEIDVDRDPLVQFERWYEDAVRAGTRMPQAMALATASGDRAPSARMVLLKGLEMSEFVFFTGYVSRKAGELAENPRAALLFYWDPLGRQVRVEGTVRRVSAAESDAYFATRPRGAQLAAAASRQSAVLSNREELDERVAELEARYAGDEVPRPEHWGGYRLAPELYEFWQHREDRAHDRLRYRREGGDWILERLSP
jgi:pyridoxamine 5'-phosphate oxidase